MSMHKSTYLILGIKFTENDMKFWGFDNLYDDRLLPYVEGRSGVFLDIISGEGSDDIYAGKVLARSDYDDGGNNSEIITIIKYLDQIMPSIIGAGIPCKFEQIKLYFVDLWG